MESITILPPAIGYILSNIGYTDYERSIALLSKELKVSPNSLRTFCENLTSDVQKKMKMGNRDVLFPQSLLVYSNELSPGSKEYGENFMSAQLIEKRPSIPINLNMMVTTSCTTNCHYCYAKRRFKNELQTDEIIRLINECHEIGVVNLNITGGDIFAMKDWKSILSKARKCGYNPFISTKTPLSESDVEYLGAIGVPEIQFSIDARDEQVLQDLIGVRAGYMDAVANMFAYCEKNDINLCIRTVLCNQNAEIPFISELYRFICQYACIKNWVLTPAFFSEHQVDYHRYKASNDKLAAVAKYIKGLDASFPIYLSKISTAGYRLKRCSTVSDYVVRNQTCHANSYSMSVLASGDCSICEMLYDKEEYLIGNIREQSLSEIWNGKKALALYAPLQERISVESPCSQCGVFEKCKNGIDKKVCYVDIAKTVKSQSFDFPDPKCPMAKYENSEVIL